MSAVNGFDCYGYPGDDRISWLRQHGQFRVTGFYLAHSPTLIDDTWSNAKRTLLAAAGWGFFPTYVGLQKGGGGFSAAKGTQHGQQAASLMTDRGFPTTSVVYLDLESGDTPTGAYASYISAWISAVKASNFTPGIYCSHVFASWSLQQTPIVWSFHIPSGTEGQSYDPDNLPSAFIDPGCIATQYRQNVQLNGLTIPASVDSGGIDLDLCAVADPSNFAAVHQALNLP